MSLPGNAMEIMKSVSYKF